MLFRSENPNANPDDLQQLIDDATQEQNELNDRLRTQLPNWVKIQRLLPNDTRREDTQITFIDNNRNLPDWYSIVRKIKTMGEELGYNLQHYKNVLDRFVGYFNPELKATTDDLQAVDLARFLLKIAMPAPKYDRLHQNIQKLTRQPNENIRNVAAKLHGMVSAFYSNKPEAEREPLINRLMIQGLTHFTTGTTNAKLISALEFAQVNNETPNWNSLLDSVANSERVSGMPTVALQFKTAQTPVVSFFNTVAPSVDYEPHFRIDSVSKSVGPNPHNDFIPHAVYIPAYQRRRFAYQAQQPNPPPQIGRAHV